MPCNGKAESECYVYNSQDHNERTKDEFVGFYHPGWSLGLLVRAVVEETEDPLDDD